jgi:hypothetical protein
MNNQPKNNKIKANLSDQSIDMNAPLINSAASKRIFESHELELDTRLKRYESGKTFFVTWANLKNELNNS